MKDQPAAVTTRVAARGVAGVGAGVAQRGGEAAGAGPSLGPAERSSDQAPIVTGWISL